MKKFRLAFLALLSAVAFSCEKSEVTPSSPYQYTFTQDLEGANSYDYTKENQVIGLDFLSDGSIDVTFESVMFMAGMPELTMSVNIADSMIVENYTGSYSFICPDTLAPTMNGADASAYAVFSNLEFVFTATDIISSFDITTYMVTGNPTYSFEYASTSSITTDDSYTFSGYFNNNNVSFPYGQGIDVVAVPNSDNTKVDLIFKQFKFISFMLDYIDMTIPGVPCTYDATGEFTATITDAITPVSDEDLSSYGDVTSLSFTFSYRYRRSMTGTFTLNNANVYNFTTELS